MLTDINLFNQLVSSVALGLQILMVAGLCVFLFYRKREEKPRILEIISEKGVVLAFTVAFFASAGSLYYTEVLGLIPCELCWYQRIFMYPQAFLLGMAVWKKDKANIADYGIMLSIIGALIAAYHYYLQMFAPEGASACDVSTGAPDCADILVFEWGYITIPMMALTAFLLIIFLLLANKNHNNKVQ